MNPVEQTQIQLRAFRSEDLASFVTYWNQVFNTRRGFFQLTEALFLHRILESPAFDPSGLILAWHRDQFGTKTITGLVQAFRPPPDNAAYRRWGRHHTIALLYVSPQHRRQGVGSRLLKAAESWLYYCPVHFAGQSVPCYGNVEGPQQPLFGGSQHLGVNVNEKELLHFLSKRGYKVMDPGDVSMTATLASKTRKPSGRSILTDRALRLLRVDNASPFQGKEPPDRIEHAIWGNNPDYAYAAFALIDDAETLRGHLCWYPLRRDGSQEQIAGIYGFWLEPALRGKGLGSLLLDTALHDMVKPSQLGGPFRRVEVQTHVVRHPDAVALYESRGFQIDDAWVTLVKT